MLPTPLSSRLVSGLVLGFVLSCATAPTPVPTRNTPTPDRDTIAIIPPAGGPTTPTFSYHDGVFDYALEQRTVVTVGTDSTNRMDDTLVTSAILTYVIQRFTDTLVAVARIDSLTITSTRDTSALPRRLATSVTLELRPVIDSVPSATLDSTVIPSGCDSMEEAARAIARDLHIRIPAGVRPGQRWADSTSATICRGGIPMTAITIATFEVQGVRTAGDTIILPILRRSFLVLTGSGMQGSRRITITGEGTSEMLFLYDFGAGALLEGVGESTLRLHFETIQQTEQVSQRSSSRVQLRSFRHP